MTREQREALTALLELAVRVVTAGTPSRGHGHHNRVHHELRLAGGKFAIATRKARRIRDIATGEWVSLPATHRVIWKGPKVTP